MMYVEMGEETDTEYQVTFRSYTGSLTYFYVNKSDGKQELSSMSQHLILKKSQGQLAFLIILDKNN